MKAQTQLRIVLVVVLIILACLILSLIIALISKSWPAFGTGLLVTMLFATYAQGLVRKDLRIARRAYRTYFVLWLISCGTILICLPSAISDLYGKYHLSRIGIGRILLFWVIALAFSLLLVFLLRIGIRGLSQIPEARNKSIKAPLLWWAFVPVLILLLLFVLSIIGPILANLLRTL